LERLASTCFITEFLTLNKIIEGEEFSDNVFGLHIKNINAHNSIKVDFEKLEDFQPDLQSKIFSRFIRF